jgi:hypothetical protein
MSNPFDTPLVNDIRKLMSEEVTSKAKIIAAPAGAIALNYIDITDPDDPEIVFRGAGTLKWSSRFSFLKNEMRRMSEMNWNATQLLHILTDIDGKKRSGKLTMYYIKGFAEAEQLMETPSVKAKLTIARKAKTDKGSFNPSKP